MLLFGYLLRAKNWKPPKYPTIGELRNVMKYYIMI